MLTALALAAVPALAVLLTATAAPAIRSGRRSQDGALPLVAPAGTGFGGATAMVAVCAARPVAAERTSPERRPTVRGHRSIRSAVHLAA